MMNAIAHLPRFAATAVVLASCSMVAVALGGCHRTPDLAVAGSEKSATTDKGAAAADAADGVVLTPEEIGKMGLVTTEVQKLRHVSEVSGFGMVVAHESIAAAVAELRTASAMERQSRSAFMRGRRLAGTPGAMPADTLETAERQVTVDQAALDLARRKLSSSFGQHPPWKAGDSPELAALADGELKLVRVTFPLGAISGPGPTALRLSPIDLTRPDSGWQARSVWSAPADASIPGRSFFAILKGSEAGEGERLVASAPVGEAQAGVEIPSAATIISNGKYWCYVEAKPGTFVRIEIDPGAPTAAGYFVKDGVFAGDKVVTQAVGLLLARETNPSTAAE